MEILYGIASFVLLVLGVGCFYVGRGLYTVYKKHFITDATTKKADKKAA